MSDLPVIFSEIQVPAVLQQELLADPEFKELDVETQRELILYKIEQGGLTTENVRIKLPFIKVRHGGANSLELPGDKMTRSFEGVILDQHIAKAFWENTAANGSAPDCQSVDGVTPARWVKGDKKQSDSCVSCPHNKFGTALKDDGSKGRGKRCRDTKRMVISVEGQNLPARLQVPSTVIRDVDSYLSQLVNDGTELGTVITEISAYETHNKDGIASTALAFKTVRKLGLREQLELKRNVVDPFKDQFRQTAFEEFDDDAAPALSAEDKKASEALSQATADGASL